MSAWGAQTDAELPSVINNPTQPLSPAMERRLLHRSLAWMIFVSD